MMPPIDQHKVQNRKFKHLEVKSDSLECFIVKRVDAIGINEEVA